ncbi:restriction endonuclease [Planomonospora sphaerica]|uniref:Restriction endonuclease n=1 Tax=Planomonospora sphaerica TaxID=161355 RepID=A0A171D1W8_9ACTN|nr:Uma2 family endonuclease [Planomonospora sphaerica]GAT67543.1 restriction endonuclease [Planomonospora sphaerica]
MAKVLREHTASPPREHTVTPERYARAELERLYREDCERHHDRKVEIINGRIVVRELPTSGHADIIYQLTIQLIPLLTKRGWKIWQDIKIFLHPQLDRYRPDITVVPPGPKMWDDENVWGNETLLVVEVVSPSSVEDDHVTKPRNCALAGVPLYLVIDPFKRVTRLLSHPSQTGYRQRLEIPIGGLLELPAPWNFTIDTGTLIEE